MQLTFLGTAASEGYPHPICRCANCERARELGGPSLRKRSAALVNDNLLIDFGPDLVAASLQHGIPLTNLRYGLQTHEHDDHLDPAHFSRRSRDCAPGELTWLDYYATAGTFAKIAAHYGNELPAAGLADPDISEKWRMTVHEIAPFQSFAVGPYQVTSVLAAHDTRLVPLLFIIEREGYTLFYATDTGPLPDATWQFLQARRPRFNLVALDHTYGLDEQDIARHMTQHQFVAEIARWRETGLLAPNCRILAHHFAHHSNPPHPELVASAAAHGYDVAYDGLTLPV